MKERETEMNITGFEIYLITRLDGLKELLTISAVLVVLLSLILVYISIDEKKDKIEAVLTKCGICGFVFSAILAFGNIMTPNTKEAAAIVILPRVINSSEVKKTCGELYNLAMEWVEYMKPPKP